MEQTETITFIIIVNIILLVFITGIILFINEYRKRKLQYEKEKQTIAELHTQELLTTQLEIQQQTMQYIGREIHDNVGQKLTLAALYTQQLGYKNKYPEINEQLTGIGNIINESLTELRSLSKNLTDTYLQKTPLTELIKTECDKVNALGNCKASVESGAAQIQAGITAKTIIVRILQEFMQNSLKHSGCTKILIQVQPGADGLLIKAMDNGNGFETETTSGMSNGIGLVNMKKRADLIDASFQLESMPGKGTSIHLFIAGNKINH